MLTKDLLKINRHKGFIQPQFIDPKDSQALDLAKKLLDTVDAFPSRTQSELEDALTVAIEGETLYYASGFVKILLDQIDYAETKENLEEVRWDLMKLAQNLRQEQYFLNKEQFQETFSKIRDNDFKTLSSNLYSDLPEFRQMKNTLAWRPEELLFRYNCALVQSLLLLAPKVHIDLPSSNIVEKRHLFRALKFHRLVVGDIRSESSSISFTIDGPLSLLINTQAYGMRLANFFPRLVMMKQWNMEADLEFKKKSYKIRLQNSVFLKSHYKEWGDYRPEEFADFLTAYNKNSSDWQAQWCDELVPLGGQEFCCPDITFVDSSKGHKIHLELFHRWHRGELEKRITNLQKNHKSKIIIGICNSLFKQDSMGSAPIQEHVFKRFGFIFRGVPTPKAVNTLLNQAYGE